MELRQYVSITWKWLWLIVLATVIAAGSSYYASRSMPRVYQTSITLMVGQTTQDPNTTSSDIYTSRQLAETYAQVATRQSVLEATAEALGFKTGWQVLKGRVMASVRQGTQLLDIRVMDTDPQRAKAIADELGRQLIVQSPTAPENAAREEHRAFVENQIASLQAKIEAAQGKTTELEAELGEAFSARQIQDLQGQINVLEGQINAWQGNYAQLLNFVEGGSPNYLTVIEAAQLPLTPISPRPMRNMLLAAAIGLTLAVGAAFLMEYLDDTIKSTDDVVTSLELPSLGAISRMRGQGYEDKLIAAQHPRAPVSEAYRDLRTNIQFSTVDKPAKTLLVTSPNPIEGKSVTAANLAIVMARAGLKAVLIDSDLRRPVQHKLFKAPNQTGLTSLALQEEPFVDGSVQETQIENLDLITSGPIPPNPSELLGSRRMEMLLETLKESYDIILFDSPPVLAVTDASVLATRVDGVVMVADVGRTRRDMALRARDKLLKVGANLLGVVLNRVGHGERGYYYYYYSRDDGSQEERRHRDRRYWWQHIPLLGLLGRK